jgi:2OG-Fe(II) oxygenase superfamily
MTNCTHKSITDEIVQLARTEFTEIFAIYTWEFSPEVSVMALCPRAAAHAGLNSNDKAFEDLHEKMRSGAIPMARAGFMSDTGRESVTRHSCADFGRQCYAKMNISTTPFEKADPLVTELVGRAKAIVLDRLGVEMDFNETLCLAYLPDMSMGWHNDREAGLNDIIISHSFGANCEMKFAMKGHLLGGEETNNHDKCSADSR